MSIKTSKRIALGVIASLVFAPFAAIAPANAAAATAASGAGNTVRAGESATMFTANLGNLDASAADTVALAVSAGPTGGVMTIDTVGGDDGTNTTHTVGASASNYTESGNNGFGGTSVTAAAFVGSFSLPGVYTVTIGAGTTTTATVTVLPSTSTTTALTATPSTATPIASATDITIVVARNAGAAKTDGIILGEVLTVNQAGTTAPATVGTVFGKTASKVAGMTVGTAVDASTTFTMDLAATSASGSYGAGTYSFRFWNDVNLNQTYDSNEIATTVTIVVGGAADSISVTISDTVLSSDSNYNTFTVTATVSDADGTGTTDTVLVSETTSTGSTSGDANLTTIADATALTRIGTTNQYTGTFTVDTAVTSADFTLTYVTVYVGSISATSDLTSINTIRVVKKGELDATAGASTMFIEDKVGIGKYTAGVRDTLTGDAGTDITVTVDKTVTSHKYTFNAASGDEGEYLLIAVAPAGTTSSSVVAPVYTHVQIGAQLTATYTVTATSPAAADSYTITVTDGSGDNTVATVTFATAAPAWTTSPSSNFKAKFGDTLSITGTLADQFGRVLDGKSVYVDVAASGRNGGRVNGTTDSAGKYTFTWTDASASTTVLTDSITFKYDYAATATSKTLSTASSTALTVTYSATGIVVGSVFVSAPSATQTRAIDQKAAAGLPRASARVTYTATVYDADGVAVGSGVLVTFTGGADDLFYAGATGVTASDGTASVVVYRTKAGSAAITATAGGVSSSPSAAVKWTNDVENGDDTTTAPNSSTADYYARYITLTADPASGQPEGIIRFVAKVTDRWGNPVAGVAVTFSETGIGRFMTGQTNPADTNALGEVSIDLNTVKGEVGTVSVSALITDANAVQKDDIAGYMTHTAEAGNTYTSTSTVVAGITAAVKSATATATVANPPAPVVPEVVVPPVAPTLQGSLNGRVLLFGSCMADEGDMIIYVKSPGKAWNEKAKTLECVAGEFDGSMRAPKNNKFYRVKQEGTGLWSSSVLIRP